MKRSLLVLALSAPLLAAPATSARAAGPQPGEWEQAMTITTAAAPGSPQQKTIRQCITSADAALASDPKRLANEMVNANPQKKCKVEEAKQEGNALTVVLACEGDVRLYARQDFQATTGTIDAEIQVGGVSQSSNHIVSKKLSDTCSSQTIELWKAQNPGKTFAP